MPSERVLRLDFTATDGRSAPGRLDVGSNEVVSILRIPQLPGVLPENVSVRFLVTLGQPDLAWSVDPSQDKVTVFIGSEEKARGGGLVLQDLSFLGTPSPVVPSMQPGGARTERPAPDDLLDRSLAFVVPIAQPIRAAPSAVSAEVGWARAGETKLADARREDWVHVVGGGWLRLPAAGDAGSAGSREASPAPARAARLSRSPAAWSVVTLGTGLQADVEEILVEDPDHQALARLFREPIRAARLGIRVQGGNFSFQLPPKRGRLQATLPGDRVVDSLDPREMVAVDAAARERIDAMIDAPSLGAGDTWETVVFFPGDLDFLAIERIRLDVGGMQHGLFRVPGSGETEPEDAPEP